MTTNSHAVANIATLTKFGAAPFFVLCDHASNTIPPEYNGLGMSDELLQTHIAWDIGASAVAANVAKQLGATYLQCAFSRLLIDPNRELTAHGLIPVKSDQVLIPGNQLIDETEREKRIALFHAPYHQRLDQSITEISAQHAAPLIISVHSFTHKLMDASEDRPWSMGFLWREDENSARKMMAYLRKNTGWEIGDNKPYDAQEFNYSVDRHIGPRKLPHITIEVRQDLIRDTRGIEEVAQHITNGVLAMSAEA